MNKLLLLLSVAAITTSATAASASTVFVNVPLDNTLPGGSYSATTGQMVANPFTVAADSAITHVTWYGVGLAGANVPFTDFTAIFFGDSSGLPGTLLASTTGVATDVNTGLVDINFHPIHLFGMDIPTFNALAGVDYHVSISDAGPYNFAWALAQGCCQEITGSLQSGNWFINGQPAQQAFTLSGAGPVSGGVPEPASWALTITGLGMMGAVLRRRRGLAVARA